MEVEKRLIKFALSNILTREAVKQGKYHDQDTLEDDMQGIIDRGELPSGWYELNESADIFECSWVNG
jgi:hypothetical protein